MTEPRWLTSHEIIVTHERQLVRFGGPPGLRDENALESALARPINKWRYEEGDLASLAAAYAFGLARNHAFIDGNKRIAFVAMVMFLRLNGVPFKPNDAEATVVIRSLAAGETDEAGLLRWIRDTSPRP
jgi:death-on-curing protein